MLGVSRWQPVRAQRDLGGAAAQDARDLGGLVSPLRNFMFFCRGLKHGITSVPRGITPTPWGCVHRRLARACVPCRAMLIMRSLGACRRYMCAWGGGPCPGGDFRGGVGVQLLSRCVEEFKRC